MADRSVSEIGKYKILEVVGEGAMGVVYKATDGLLNRTVAIKVMSDAIARQSELRSRFLREAQAAGSMQHPNIVSIYDLGDKDGHLYIAMEFVEGVDLEQIIANREPLALQAKLDIIIDVLSGLAYAHKRGIVHRDIKPANIRITEDGRAKIMDFGVAHLASSTMTATGMVVGTPAYMAPEQVTGALTTAATDLFAVGAVLYELLTGLKAFAAPTLQSLFYKIVSEPPVSLMALNPGLPEELNAILEKALEKAPADRYASALEMANDLTSVRAKLSGAPHPGTVSLTASVANAMAAQQQTQARPRRIAIIGALIGAAAVASIWFVGSRSGRAAREEQRAAAFAPPVAATPSTTAETPPPTPPATLPKPQGSDENRPSSTKTEEAPATLPLPPAKIKKIASKPPPPPPPARSRETVTQPGQSSRKGANPAPVLLPPTPPRENIPTQNTAPRIVVPAPVPPPAPPPVAAPAPAPAPPPAPPPSPRLADVAQTVEAYARAIESRDVGAIRRVYPRLTAGQAADFERFFQTARRVNVSFRVSDLEGNGNTAEARLSGRYDYVTADGNRELAVSFAASFRYDGSDWRLVSIR